MYNDACKTDACCAPEPVDSMRNIVGEIHDRAMKARQMAFDIYKKLFGEIKDEGVEGEVNCAFDVLGKINRMEKETLEVLYAVIERIGE